MRRKLYVKCGVWERKSDVMGDESDINGFWKNRKLNMETFSYSISVGLLLLTQTHDSSH